jgi:hypothetical protein
MDLGKKSVQEETQGERLALFNRLAKQKDAILAASQDIENLRKQFLQANKKDDDGTIESEIQKRIYVIISALSELAPYAKNPGVSEILMTTVNVATHHRIYEQSRFLEENNNVQAIGHVALSKVLDAMCAAANSVSVEWRLKREPLVNFRNLESLLQMKFPGHG